MGHRRLVVESDTTAEGVIAKLRKATNEMCESIANKNPYVPVHIEDFEIFSAELSGKYIWIAHCYVHESP